MEFAKLSEWKYWIQPARRGKNHDDPFTKFPGLLRQNGKKGGPNLEIDVDRMLPGRFAHPFSGLVRAYLNRLLGYPEENIAFLLNDRATRTDLEKFLGPWLKNRVNDQSQVFVYYAGHGSPDPKTGEGFIVPYDGDPNYLAKTGYPMRELYAALSDLPAKRVFVALDACFSGADGRSVIAKGARPLVISQPKAAAAGDHLVILSAASGAQISTSSDARKHGLFTYYLLQGLRGEADPGRTGEVTVGRLFHYVRANVEREARRQNVEQTPMLQPVGKEIESLRLR